MKPSEFKQLFIGERGTDERNVRRDDGIFSDRYVRLMLLSHPTHDNIYVEYVLWRNDARVDIKVAERNTNGYLTPLKHTKFISKKYKNDPHLNIFRLQYLDNGIKKDHTLSSLSSIVGQPILNYLQGKGIKLLKQADKNGNSIFYAQHKYYSDSELLELYLISVIIPFLKNIPTNQPSKTYKQTNSSVFNSFKEKIIVFGLACCLLTGCYTCATRKRIGATCSDGWHSSSTGSGACSHHGGVRKWEYEYWWDR